MQMSFLLKRKLGKQEDGEDSDHDGRRCYKGSEGGEYNEGDKVKHCPLKRSISYSQDASTVFLLLGVSTLFLLLAVSTLSESCDQMISRVGAWQRQQGLISNFN